MNSNKSRWLSRTIASFFGIGYFPGFPGTVASLVTAVLAYLAGSNIKIIWVWDVEVFFILILLGLVSGADLVRHLGIKDPKWFVMDEVAGMWLSLLILPKNNIWVILIAFIMFRVFDIWKPWLIRRVEKVPGATGIMLDDVVAAVPAWVITFGIWKLFL